MRMNAIPPDTPPRESGRRAPPARAGGGVRNGEVDFARIVAAVGIMLFHARFLWRTKNPPFLHGNYGVDFFFLLSGLLMAKSIASGRADDTFAYLKRKIASFYPVFAASVLLAGVSYCAARGMSPVETLLRIGSDAFEFLLLGQSGLTAFTGFNGAAWYLSAMVIAMAALHPVATRARRWFFPVGSVLLAVVCYGILFQNRGGIVAGHAWTGFCTYRMVRAVAGVSLGVFVFEMAERTRRSVSATSLGRRLILAARAILAAAALTILLNPPIGALRQLGGRAGFFCLFLFAAYLYLAFSGLAEARLFRSGRFGWCGPASLYLYLNHVGVLHLLNRDFVRGSGLSTGALFALFFGGTLAACLACAALAALLRRLARTVPSLLVAGREPAPTHTKETTS